MAARVFLLIAVLATRPLVAAAADSFSATDGDRSGQDRHFLWKAKSPNGAVVYLLGSIHALPEDDYPLAAQIEEAFDSAHTVFFEVDMENTSAMGRQLLSAGALPQERLLDDILDPETKRLVDAHLEASGLSFGAIEAMKPWMAALTLTSIELMKAGFSPDAGLDIHLARRAREQGKAIGAFETAEYQIGLFSAMDEDAGRAFLRYTLKDIDAVGPQLDVLTDAWKNGDIEVITALLTEAFSE